MLYTLPMGAEWGHRFGRIMRADSTWLASALALLLPAAAGATASIGDAPNWSVVVAAGVAVAGALSIISSHRARRKTFCSYLSPHIGLVLFSITPPTQPRPFARFA